MSPTDLKRSNTLHTGSTFFRLASLRSWRERESESGEGAREPVLETGEGEEEEKQIKRDWQRWRRVSKKEGGGSPFLRAWVGGMKPVGPWGPFWPPSWCHVVFPAGLFCFFPSIFPFPKYWLISHATVPILYYCACEDIARLCATDDDWECFSRNIDRSRNRHYIM